jgi:hypothetical protein
MHSKTSFINKFLFSLFCAHLLDKILTFGKINEFILPHLIEFFVPLASPKVLSLGKT